jgi:hypothetical protein
MLRREIVPSPAVSNREVCDAASAWEKVTWYACRYSVEEYHKAQKTGCQIEDLQFRTVFSVGIWGYIGRQGKRVTFSREIIPVTIRCKAA